MIISVLISMFDLSPISDMRLLFCPLDNLLRSKMSSGHFTSKKDVPRTLYFEVRRPPDTFYSLPTKGDNLLQGRTVYFEVKCPREANTSSKVSGGRFTSK